MTNDATLELKEKIEEEIKEFLDILRINVSPIPEAEIYEIVNPEDVEDDNNWKKDPEYGYKSKNIKKPSDAIGDYRGVRDFEQIAEWGLENEVIYPGWTIKNTLTPDNEREIELVPPEEKLEDGYPEEAIEPIAHHMRSMAGKIADRVGNFEFEEDVFDEVFESFIENSTSTELSEVEVICPIFGIDIECNSIEVSKLSNTPTQVLSDDFEKYGVGMASSIKIEQLDENEILAILMKADDVGNEGLVPPQLTDKLKFEYTGFPLGPFQTKRVEPLNQFCEQITTGLRLIEPNSNISTGLIMTKSGTYSYPDDLPNLTGPQFELNDMQSTSSKIKCDESKADEISNKWDVLKQHIETYSVESLEGDFDKPLDRFNEMFDEDGPEDAIIDCFIGLELTLLKDLRPNYAFRFPSRGTLMLTDGEKSTSQQLYDTFNLLYKARNDIVHQDESLGEILQDSDRPDAPSDFVTEARELFGELLIKYFEIMEDHDMNTTQINQELLDEAMKSQLRNVPYPPEHSG